MGRLISYVCSDEDVLAYLDGLPEGTSISEAVREILRAYVRGELVKPSGDLAAAKLEGAKLDNRIKEEKLKHITPLAELKKDQLRADIELKTAQLKVSDAALAKITAPKYGGAYRYMLPVPGQKKIQFVCPHCHRTREVITSYMLDSYLPAKQRLITHMADEHMIGPHRFDEYTFYYFKNFELTFYGREYPAWPQKSRYMNDEYFDGPKELPLPEAE